MENILRNSGSVSGELLQLLVNHCRDPSTAVRKQIVTTLTDLLLENPGNEALVDSWVRGSLPLVKDVESKIAEKTGECLFECLLENLVPRQKAATELHALPWSILRSVERGRMELYLCQAVSVWAKEGRITKGHISSLQTYLEAEQSAQAWLCLSILTNYVSCTDPHFVLEFFNRSLERDDVGLNTIVNISKVLFASVSKLSEDAQTTLMDHLLLLIQTFKLPVEVISICVDIVTAILKQRADNVKVYTSAVEGWTVGLLARIEDLLTDQILNIPTHMHSEKTVSRYLFTLGEIVQLSYTRTTRKLFLILQSIVFFRDGSGKEQESPVFSQQVECRFSPSDRLRALAVGTLGKMCLQVYLRLNFFTAGISKTI